MIPRVPSGGRPRADSWRDKVSVWFWGLSIVCFISFFQVIHRSIEDDDVGAKTSDDNDDDDSDTDAAVDSMNDQVRKRPFWFCCFS